MPNTPSPLSQLKFLALKQLTFPKLILVLITILSISVSTYLYLELVAIKQQQKTEEKSHAPNKATVVVNTSPPSKPINKPKKRDQDTSRLKKETFDKALYKTKYSVMPFLHNNSNNTPKPFSFFDDNKLRGINSRVTKEKRTFGIRTKSYDGGGGHDTYMQPSAGKITLDGVTFKNIETYDLINGKENRLFITTPGLADLGSGKLKVLGDPSLDTIVMDGCLQWSEQNHQDGFKTFIATDTQSRKRKVVLDKHLNTKIQKTCNSDYEQKHHIDTAKNISLKNKQDDEKTEPNHPIKQYTPQKENNIDIYSNWANGFRDITLRKNLKLLTAIMREANFPTEFPHYSKSGGGSKYTIENLYFSPKSSPVSSIQNRRDCGNEHRSVHYGIFTNPTDARAGIKCSHGNQLYSLNDASESIDDSWGNDLVFPGKGEDHIDLGWGQDIVVLEKEWGNKTIIKTCHNSEMKDETTFHSDTPLRTAYVGIGMHFYSREDDLFIMDVFPSSPAGKAGLKKGDIITKLSGRPISQISKNEVITTLRGRRNKEINIQYKWHPTSDIRNVSLKPTVIDRTHKNRFKKNANKPDKSNQVTFDWPYKYFNFLVFGPGIYKEDIEEQAPGKFVHKKTGDVVTLPNCFNIFYSGDINFDFDAKKEAVLVSTNKKLLPEVENYKEIPTSMLTQFKAGDELDKFVEIQSRQFLSRFKNGDFFDEEFVLHKKEEALKDIRQRQISLISHHDDNLDGIVSRDEAEASISKRYKNSMKNNLDQKYKMINNSMQQLMAFDTNTDDFITRDEMLKVSSKEKEKALKTIRQRYDRYFEFDTNDDKKVNYPEFKSTLETSFKIVDLNDDKIISKDEYSALHNKIQTLKYQKKRSVQAITLLQYSAAVRSSIIRTITRRKTKLEDFLFDSYHEEKTYDEPNKYVFHPSSGGNVNYKEPNSLFLEKNKASQWIFSSGWQIEKIGTDKSFPSSNEIIAFLPYISHSACKQINVKAGIKNNGIDADNDNIPRGTKNNILPQSSHGMTKKNPGITKLLDVIGQTAFARKSFGCFDTSDGNGNPNDGPYVYYHALIEQ